MSAPVLFFMDDNLFYFACAAAEAFDVFTEFSPGTLNFLSGRGFDFIHAPVVHIPECVVLIRSTFGHLGIYYTAQAFAVGFAQRGAVEFYQVFMPAEYVRNYIVVAQFAIVAGDLAMSVGAATGMSGGAARFCGFRSGFGSGFLFSHNISSLFVGVKIVVKRNVARLVIVCVSAEFVF